MKVKRVKKVKKVMKVIKVYERSEPCAWLHRLSCFKRANGFVLTFAWRLKHERRSLETGQGIKASKTREESMKRKQQSPQTKQAPGRSA